MRLNPRAELAEYLGAEYDSTLLTGSDALVLDEFRRYHSPIEFYKRNTIYLYHLTVFGQSIWKQSYYQFVRETTRPCEMLDYGCGIGMDGLALAEHGYVPAFADYESRCTNYLKRRVQKRGWENPVYDIETSKIPRYPLVTSLNVMEHIEPDKQWPFLQRLAELGQVVIINMINRPPIRKGLYYRVNAQELELKIEKSYTILSAKTYHEFARTVAFATPEPTRQRKPRKKTKE